MYENCGGNTMSNEMNSLFNSVSNPKHYQILGMKCIDIIFKLLSKDEFAGFCKGNSLKYRLRAGNKGNAEEDIAKAQVYEHWYDLLQDGTLTEPNMQIDITDKTLEETTLNITVRRYYECNLQ